MGSALTVLLSVSREINLVLLGTILIKSFYNPLQLGSYWIFLIMFFIMLLPYVIEMPKIFTDLTNYYAFPLPAALEILLVYILSFILYKINGESASNMSIMIYLLVLYTLAVGTSLYPSDTFDGMAAKNFWANLFGKKTGGIIN
jgi:hypothetical protein